MTDNLYGYHFPPTQEPLKEGERVHVSADARDSTGTALFGDGGYGISYEPPFIYIGPDSDEDLVVADREGGEISVSPGYVYPHYEYWEVELLRADDIEAGDPVHQPSHYKGGGLEVIDVIEGFDLNYRLGNAQKYLLRAGKKGSDADAITDLKKAIQYISREVNAREGRRSW